MINPEFSNSEQNLPLSLKGYLKFFSVFRNFYIFIPRFSVEPLKTFGGALAFRRSVDGINSSTSTQKPY
jgi:hypothetical protein